MGSNDGGERPSIIRYNSFLNDVYGVIIQPPPQPAWATASDDDAVNPRDTEMAVVPDFPVDASSMTQLPSSNGNDALIATRSASAPNEEISLLRSPPPVLLEDAHFEEPGRDIHHPTLLSQPMFSSLTFIPTNEENTRSVIYDEVSGGEEEKLEEEDYAPLPPETIAASFEAAKTDLIKDDDDASVPPEQIAVPFEGHGDEEGTRIDVEDDYAPVPPEMLAASFEAVMPELIDDDYTLLPPDMVAASFEGHGDEEEKQEEVEDDWAPAPPEMVASSYEGNDDTKQEAKKKSEVIEDKDGANINNAQGIINFINTSGNFVQGIGASSLLNSMQNIHNLMDESRTFMSENGTDSIPQNVLNNETPLLTNMQPSSTNNEQFGALSITPTPQRDDDSGSPVSVGITIYPTPEFMLGPRPSIDPSHQSLPVLEGTLVQDVPDGPVYLAFPLNTNQDIDSHRWLM